MAKQDIQTIIGSSISKDEALLKNFKSIKSCFVGWIESYNETSGTVNVQPAIQDYIPNDEQNGSNYRNSPLLVNVWVLGTFKSTAIEKGDKAVCFVLDQKANDFFKCIYDSSLSLGFQTFKPKTSAQKSICDCVCVILGDANFQEVYEAISAIDTALENKADIDGTYPNMTVGKATNADNATNASQLGGVDASSYATLSQVVRTDTAQTLTDREKETARNNTTTFISKGLPSAGWYRIAELPTSGFFEIEFSTTFYATTPSPCKVFISYGYTIANKYSLTSINSNSVSPLVKSVRLISVGNKKYVDFYYNGTNSRDIVGIVMSGVSHNDTFARITPIDFTPVDDTGTIMTSLDITSGINTTGNIYRNGAPVLAVDPTTLTPSTTNGWSGGTSTSIPSTSGAYWVKVDNQPITLIAYYVGGDWVSGTTIWYKQA